jgi:hypothetical protein
MRLSFDRDAASMNSIADQSICAIAMPGSGFINERIHVAGEKIHSAAAG